jgi:hypothetical protein
VPTTPEQHQEVDFEEEGEEADAEDQQNAKASTVSLQQEVRDLSAKLNQVLGAVTTLTKQVNSPRILQEAAGAQSAPGSIIQSKDNPRSQVEGKNDHRLDHVKILVCGLTLDRGLVDAAEGMACMMRCLPFSPSIRTIF